MDSSSFCPSLKNSKPMSVAHHLFNPIYSISKKPHIPFLLQFLLYIGLVSPRRLLSLGYIAAGRHTEPICAIPFFISYSFNHFRAPAYSQQTPLNKLAGYSLPHRRRRPSWESPNGHCTSWWLGLSCASYHQQQGSCKQQHSMKWHQHIPHGEGAACWDFPMKMLYPQTVQS